MDIQQPAPVSAAAPEPTASEHTHTHTPRRARVAVLRGRVRARERGVLGGPRLVRALGAHDLLRERAVLGRDALDTAC